MILVHHTSSMLEDFELFGLPKTFSNGTSDEHWDFHYVQVCGHAVFVNRKGDTDLTHKKI